MASLFRGVAVLAVFGFIAACGEPPTRPPAAVASVVVGPAVVVIASGATQQYGAIVTDANGNNLADRTVVWSIDDNSVATISATGFVTALPNALATDRNTVVRATVEGKVGAANLSVAPSAVVSIEISAFAGVLDAGETPTLTAVARDASNAVLVGRQVTWTSRDLTAARVTTPGGVLSAVAFLGDANRTVRIVASIGLVADSIDIEVSPTALTDLQVQPRAPFVEPGWTKTLRTEGLFGGGAAVTRVNAIYTSSNPSVASITSGGVVTVPLGSSGTTEIIATFGPLADTVTLTVDDCGAAPAAGTYPLEIRFYGVEAPSPSVQAAFDCAANRIRAIIKDPLSLVSFNGPTNAGTSMTNCTGESAPLFGQTQGLIIFAKVDSIDGPGQVLGSAGPCFLRSSTRLPVVGMMQFDRSDLEGMIANGTLGDVIMHEMLHVIGIGTSWRDNLRNPLLWTGDVPDPGFLGSLAKIACVEEHNGANVCTSHVPIEDCVGVSGNCGVGTKLGHWRENLFRRELMTGYISPPGLQNPFSRMTIQALADLGYTVDPHQSNDYTVAPPSLMSALRAGPASAGEKELPAPRMPTHEIDAMGRVKPLPR